MSRFLALFLVAVASSAAAQIPISTPVVEPAPFTRGGARVASNGDGFLIAWIDRRAQMSEVRAARLDRRGNLLDLTGIRVATSGGNVVVASDGRDYVLAWNCGTDLSPGTCTAQVEAESGAVRPGVRIGGGGNPAIASNGRSYLLVTQGPSLSGTVSTYIDAVELSRDASVAGTPFRVNASPYAPAIASNGEHYFVVWATYKELHGALVSESAVIGPKETITNTIPSYGPGPFAWTIASNGEDFLVAWQQNAGVVTPQYVVELQAAVVSSDGIARDPRTIVVEPERTWEPAATWTGSEYLISYTASSAAASAPYLWSTANGDVRGVRVDADARLTAGPAPIAERIGREAASAPASNGDVTVVALEHVHRPNAVQIEAAILPSGKTLVVSNSVTWQQSVAGSANTFAWEELIGEDQHREVFLGRFGGIDGRGIAIGPRAEGMEQINPAIGGSLVAWVEQRDTAANLRFRLLADALPRTLGPARAESRVAIEVSDDGHLVVWENPAGSIVAARIGFDGTVVDWNPIVVATAASRLRDPVVATDGSSFLVTFRRDEPCVILCVEPPTSVHAAVVSRTGAVTPSILLAPVHRERPAAVWNGSEFVVFVSDYPGARALRLNRAGVLVGEPIRLSDDVAVIDAEWDGDEYVLAVASKGLGVMVLDAAFRVRDSATLDVSYVAGTRATLLLRDRPLVAYQRRDGEGISRVVTRYLDEAFDLSRRRSVTRR